LRGGGRSNRGPHRAKKRALARASKLRIDRFGHRGAIHDLVFGAARKGLEAILEEIGIRTIMSSWPEFEITCAILTQICGVVSSLTRTTNLQVYSLLLPGCCLKLWRSGTSFSRPGGEVAGEPRKRLKEEAL
jgi:hypothetical protein